MSENLDLVRSIYADWEHGDFSRSDWADPEIEFVIADGPNPGTWTGLDGMAEAARWIWSQDLDDHRVQAEDYRDLDGERVLVSCIFGGRGKVSGLEIADLGATGAHLLHVRGGRVTRLVLYFDRHHAFADLGLEK
jgi:ketosteroid isomerase-like protein